MDVGPCNWGHTVVYWLQARLDPGPQIVRILSLTFDAVSLYIFSIIPGGLTAASLELGTPKKERTSSLHLPYNNLREASGMLPPPPQPQLVTVAWDMKDSGQLWSHVYLGWGEMRHLKWCLTRVMWRRCFPKGKTEEEEGRDTKIANPTEVHSKYHPSHEIQTVKT